MEQQQQQQQQPQGTDTGLQLLHERSCLTLGEIESLWLTYTEMGSRAWAADEFKNAYRLFHRAYKLADTRANHPLRLAVSKYNLALIYKHQKRYPKSLRFLESAIILLTLALGENNSHLPRVLDALGDIHVELGHLCKARRIYERAQRIETAAKGKLDPQVLKRFLKLVSLEQQSLDISVS